MLPKKTPIEQAVVDWFRDDQIASGVFVPKGLLVRAGIIDGAATCPICDCELSGPAALRGIDRSHAVHGEYAVAICGQCQAGVTLPRATDDQLGRFYPASYPHDLPSGAFSRLAAAAWHKVEAWGAFRSFPLEVLDELPPGNALDIGCGRGNLGAQLIARGWRVVGIEPSSAACAAARERGIDARTGTLLNVKVEPTKYSIAVFQHSLEHVSDPVANLRAARSALREDGLLFVTVPNFGSWQRRRFGTYWLHLDLPRHRVHFTRDSLTRAVERAGFSVVDVGVSSSAATIPMSVLQVAAGRQPFPSGLGLRLTIAACSLLYPLTRALDKMAGDGDLLHLVARR